MRGFEDETHREEDREAGPKPHLAVHLFPWRHLLGGRRPIAREHSLMFSVPAAGSPLPLPPPHPSLETTFREEEGNKAVEDTYSWWGLNHLSPGHGKNIPESFI